MLAFVYQTSGDIPDEVIEFNSLEELISFSEENNCQLIIGSCETVERIESHITLPPECDIVVEIYDSYRE